MQIEDLFPAPNANLGSDKSTHWRTTHYPVTQIYFTVVLLRHARRREEAGKRLPLGPISPSRILCAAAVPEEEEERRCFRIFVDENLWV